MTRTKLSQHSPLLLTANPNIIYLRGGEVVVYRRSASPLYQCRYKLADGKWHRISTRKASVENAVSVAYLLYDEARFRQRLGLAHSTDIRTHRRRDPRRTTATDLH
jgi:integrase